MTGRRNTILSQFVLEFNVGLDPILPSADAVTIGASYVSEKQWVQEKCTLWQMKKLQKGKKNIGPKPISVICNFQYSIAEHIVRNMSDGLGY